MIQHVALPSLAGTVAGTVTSFAPINASLLAVYVETNSAGTLTIAAIGGAPATILSLTGGAGTAWYYPRKQACDQGGTVIAGIYDAIPLNNYVTVDINAAGTVAVTLATEN